MSFQYPPFQPNAFQLQAQIRDAFQAGAFQYPGYQTSPVGTQGRSGWYRLWLIELQKKANQEWETDHAEKPSKASPVPDKAPEVVVQKAKRKAKRTERKAADVREPFIPSILRDPVLIDQPTIHELIGPEFSVSAFQKVVDFQKHQQFQHHKRQREEETLILLLAA